ncbi:unnamed protein product, partial [Laminaria digitata]
MLRGYACLCVCSSRPRWATACCCSQPVIFCPASWCPRAIVFPGGFCFFSTWLLFPHGCCEWAVYPVDARRADVDFFRGKARLTAAQQSIADCVEVRFRGSKGDRMRKGRL